MADRSPIEWTDATWNPITGCSVVSAGCKHCYAMRLAGTRLAQHPSRAGLTQETPAGPVWTGEVRFNESWLDQPLRWTKPRKIFVCAHSDLFHDAVPNEWIDRIFAIMARAPQHTFQVLTKRPGRALAYLSVAEMELRRALPESLEGRWPLPNVWLGTSVEHQRAAEDRIPLLMQAPAAVRWLSAEPLLEPVDLRRWLQPQLLMPGPAHTFSDRMGHAGRLHWVVAGGEAGRGSRPMHPDWARSLRDQCLGADVPFLFKQWGDWRSVYDRDKDDPDWRACGAQERRYPNGQWLNLAGGQGFHGDRVQYMVRMSKGIAGRELDGCLHDGYPDPRRADREAGYLAQLGTA